MTSCIPMPKDVDLLVWNDNDSETLTLKDAFRFLNPTIILEHWFKLIWSSCIPPSKYLSWFEDCFTEKCQWKS